MTNPKSGALTLVEELGGYRHYLDGEPIHAGDVLEFFDGNRLTWTMARFELIIGQRGRRAVLCTSDGSSITVDETTRLRWPKER